MLETFCEINCVPLWVNMIGWAAAIFFAVSAAPQAWKSYKEGHAEGMSKLTLFFWTMGETLMVVYTPLKVGWDWPIMSNLIGNLVFLIIIWRYVFWPRKSIN